MFETDAKREIVRVILTSSFDEYPLFTAIPSQITSFARLGMTISFALVGFSTFFQCFSATKTCTTVMRFVVNVPVLSEQIAVALPIVSQASK